MQKYNDSLMRTLNTLDDVKARHEIVSKWQKRLNTLKTKKEMTYSSFCRRYGFHLSWLSRAKLADPLPCWKKIKQVEEALKDAGV